jgi:hypothetical protein
MKWEWGAPLRLDRSSQGNRTGFGLVEQFLELYWRHIPDRGMQPLVIINFLKEVGKPILDLVQGSIFPEIHVLGFQGFDETLSRRVVVGIPLAGHTDAKAMLIEDLHVIARCILDPPIRVMNDSCRGLALGKGRPEGLQHRAVSIRWESAYPTSRRAKRSRTMAR